MYFCPALYKPNSVHTVHFKCFKCQQCKRQQRSVVLWPHCRINKTKYNKVRWNGYECTFAFVFRVFHAHPVPYPLSLMFCGGQCGLSKDFTARQSLIIGLSVRFYRLRHETDSVAGVQLPFTRESEVGGSYLLARRSLSTKREQVGPQYKNFRLNFKDGAAIITPSVSQTQTIFSVFVVLITTIRQLYSTAFLVLLVLITNFIIFTLFSIASFWPIYSSWGCYYYIVSFRTILLTFIAFNTVPPLDPLHYYTMNFQDRLYIFLVFIAIFWTV